MSEIVIPEKPSVYLESSLISMLTSRPSRFAESAIMQRYTKLWWRDKRKGYRLFVSETVIREILLGDEVAAKSRLYVVEGISKLTVTPEVDRLANKIIIGNALPPNLLMTRFTSLVLPFTL